MGELELGFESELSALKSLNVCGIDEVGRGPLAGPVISVAVVLDPAHEINGIDDSKKLSEIQRITLAESIRKHSLEWTVGRAEVEEIDQFNILQASLLSMERAFSDIQSKPDVALVDGNKSPSLRCRTITVVGGDAKFKVIGAASILAKVLRDAEMVREAQRFPEYGFERNKGYPTREHLDALRRIGPCPIHRKSFRPVAESLKQI